ncbi:MAG: membrane dipeptidase [Planctomycetales bacterium]|nr:membrane dipeptidase [Planctomycetales bacterium]
MPLIVDSHLDLAWNALSWKRDLTLPLDEMNARDAQLDSRLGRGRATITFPEMRRGGVFLCLGTLMARVPRGAHMVHGEMLDYPSQEVAFGVAQGQLAYYRQLEAMGEVRLITSRDQLGEHWQQWSAATEEQRLALPIGIILAMEGCDAIVNPEQADRWYADGLRAPALVHYGTSTYAVGTGEEGPLPAAGIAMLAEFERLGMVLDMTHLSDASFWETLDHFGGAVIASHQNCRSLVPGQRQFADEQLRAIISRDGVIGSALDAWMLHPGWVRATTLDETTSRDLVPLVNVVDHMEHICQLAGNCRHIAIGSDLDGGFGHEQTPRELMTIADLQKIAELLSQRGFSDADIDAVFHGNWMRFWGERLS